MTKYKKTDHMTSFWGHK